MGDDIKLWEVYDGYNIGYKNGKYYVDNNGELVELGGGSFQEAANIASILGIQPTEPMGGGGGFTQKSDWERQAGHLKENRAYSKAIRQQRRLQRKNKFNLNNIMGKFPIFRNGGAIPKGQEHLDTKNIKVTPTPKGHYRSHRIQDPTNRYAITQYVGGDNNQDTIYVREYPTERYIGGEPYEDIGYFYPAANRKISEREAIKHFIFPTKISSDRGYFERLRKQFRDRNPYGD